MPCYHAENLTICCPSPVKMRKEVRRFFRCPTCRKRRLCDVLYFEWYGPMGRCRTCKAWIELVFPGEE